jgi:hypothetical protein
MKSNHFTSASLNPRVGISIIILWVTVQVFLFQGLTANLSAIEIPKGFVIGPMGDEGSDPFDRMVSKHARKFVPQAISGSIVDSAALLQGKDFSLSPEADPEVSIEKMSSRILSHRSTFSSELSNAVAALTAIPETAPPLAEPPDSSQLLPECDPPAIESPQSNEADDSLSDLLDKAQDPEDRFAPIVIKAAQEHGVDPAIIKAIIKAESGYNPQAVSNRGAKGLMQLMPNTAKSLGVEDIFCPEQNILAGVKYFKQLLDEFRGSTKLALAAYNSGSQKVKKYRGIPPFKTTQLYIKKVFKYQKEYNQELADKELNPLNPQAFPSLSSF